MLRIIIHSLSKYQNILLKKYDYIVLILTIQGTRRIVNDKKRSYYYSANNQDACVSYIYKNISTKYFFKHCRFFSSV
jgi:hypothetical protein